ncbi:hypothetical protein KY290_027766 [Solanum tuberosum]|uniref:Uncharacterized protein n=1 Tax=Solanum tuberosum TaxID=4113 RepID=A0ABQ7UGG1_SOLTU|nr:hypothetical protein KY284_026781 [Solanum tuberosum]KAH0748534.1 hypothetical protein KY290_027766 [Solanum tuberosum]
MMVLELTSHVMNDICLSLRIVLEHLMAHISKLDCHKVNKYLILDVKTGWEGAANDSRIFGEALRRRYAHMRGFMAPYKGDNVRYHLPDFRRGATRQLHMPYYNIDTQRDIVLATMAIHNYIKQKCNVDDAFQTAEDERYIPSVDSEFGTSSSTNNIEKNMEEQSDTYWMRLRDMIANEIGNV